MKQKLFFFLVCVLWVGIPLNAQHFSIKGKVTDTQQEIIAGASVLLYSVKDSTQTVGATITDNRGRFNLQELPADSYRLRVSFVGYKNEVIQIDNLSTNIKDLQVTLTEQSVLLDEVAVTANRVLREFDRQVIFPGKSEKESSANGVDLIDRLYLDKVYVNRTNNSINSVQGGKVQLRINGAPADEADVMNIDPKMVTRIEYHDRPSLRYGDVLAVIDFYVKRRETGGRGNIYLNNRIDGKAVGTGRGGLSINHKKSEFSVSGFYSYLSLKDKYQTKSEDFHFENGSQLSRYKEGIPHDMKERMYTAKAGYSYYDPDNILFTANVFYNLYDMPNSLSANHIFQDGNQEPLIYMIDSTNFRESKPSFELYFQKNLKNKQLIAFDVVGTYMNTASYDSYREYKENVLSTDYLTSIKGNKYSIIAEGFYEKRFSKGRLNAGVKEVAGFADNTYSGTFPYQSNMDQYTTTAYTQWYGNLNNFSYSLGVGVTSDVKVQGGETLSELRFYPIITLGYRVGSDINLYYNGKINVQTPQLGNLNNVQISKDEYQILSGNPKLESQTTYSNVLGVGLYKRSLMLSLDASYDYSVHPMLNCTFRQDDKFITQLQNGRYSHRLGLSGFLFWNAVPKYLNVYSRFGYDYCQNVTKKYIHSFNAWMLDAGVDAMYRGVTFGINTHKDFDFLSSETKIYKYFGMSFSLSYKWKKLKIGGIVRKNLKSYQERTVNMNQYIPSESFVYLPSSDTDVRLTLSWSFDFGRKRASEEQKLHNQDLIKGILR